MKRKPKCKKEPPIDCDCKKSKYVCGYPAGFCARCGGYTEAHPNHKSNCDPSTPPKSHDLEQIVDNELRKYFNDHVGMDDFGCDGCIKYTKDMTKALREWIRERLPAEDIKDVGGVGYFNGMKDGWNACLDAVKKSLLEG